MSTSQTDATSAVPHESVRQALTKVLSSQPFHGSERSRTLLRFVVERTLNGQAEGLKEYTLGTEALGKSSAFDPRTDTVVRSEFSRLRNRLDKYYATQGQSDEVVIALSKGSYVPRFDCRPTVIGELPAAATVEPPVSRLWRRAPFAVVATALVAAIALIGYRELAPLNARSDQRPAATEEQTVSIAVLPFVNLSGDAGQDVFADGITEELTTALATIPNVLVVGRTSASQFKGERRDLRVIGRALNVSHLIEGSVRKEGDRVRITAQLVRADSGVHMWSENYDRQLTGIVALQEDVATAIAGALKLPLGLGSGRALASLRPKDTETYELFLRGRAAFRARQAEQAINLLDQVVVRDPDFAPGWRYLAQSRNADQIERRLKGNPPRSDAESQETLARRVIALAPGSADGYAMLANLAEGEGKALEAMELRKQALDRDPNDTEVMNAYANDLWKFGYLKEALAVRDRQHVLEPLVPIYNFLKAETLAASGMLDQAVRDWLIAKPEGIAGTRLLAPAYAGLKRFDDAIDELLKAEAARGRAQGEFRSYTQAQLEGAVRVLRAAAGQSSLPADLPDFDPTELLWVYAYTKTPERMLDAFQSRAKAGDTAALRYVWWPLPSSVRKTERFKMVMRDAGFLDAWRVRGWPDFCRPIGLDDFVCD